jgi:hypothetical protein
MRRSRRSPQDANLVLAVTALLTIANGISGCGEARRSPQRKSSEASAQPPAAPKVMSDAEQLAARIGTVTPDERAAHEARRQALWDRYLEAAPAPRTLFELPLKLHGSECRSQDPECAASRALYYNDELWGLGDLVIGNDGVLWVADRVTSRIVRFDRDGRLVESVFASGEGPYDLVVAGNEIWFNAMRNDPSPGWFARYERDGTLIKYYRSETGRGLESRLAGQIVSREPLRIAQSGYEDSWLLSDISFDAEHIVFAPKRPIVVNGKRYLLDCDLKGKGPATLVIGDRAVPAPGCLTPYWFGPGGDFIAGPPFYHFDSNGELIGMAQLPKDEDNRVFSDGRNYDVGPDGKLYAYVVRKRSVRFVEVPFFTPAGLRDQDR